MGNVGSVIFWAWPLLGTKSQDISASAASISTSLFLICLFSVSLLDGSTLNRCSAPLIGSYMDKCKYKFINEWLIVPANPFSSNLHSCRWDFQYRTIQWVLESFNNNRNVHFTQTFKTYFQLCLSLKNIRQFFFCFQSCFESCSFWSWPFVLALSLFLLSTESLRLCHKAFIKSITWPWKL